MYLYSYDKTIDLECRRYQKPWSVFHLLCAAKYQQICHFYILYIMHYNMQGVPLGQVRQPRGHNIYCYYNIVICIRGSSEIDRTTPIMSRTRQPRLVILFFSSFWGTRRRIFIRIFFLSSPTSRSRTIPASRSTLYMYNIFRPRNYYKAFIYLHIFTIQVYETDPIL